jgi:hypothetical protein
MDEGNQPEIIECEIRLHSAPPTGTGASTPTAADWAATVVGLPVTFRAIAITSKGSWNGPLHPGIDIAAPRQLDDPYWTVSLPACKGVPIIFGRVGRPLSIGEAFNLPPGEPGVWLEGLVFEGAIVIE